MRQVPCQIPLNLSNFLSDCEDVTGNLDLDYQAIYEDAYAIFESNPTREGAEEAARFYTGIVRDACTSVLSETYELIEIHRLNRHQRRSLKIDRRLQAFAQHMNVALTDLEAAFVESAINGTMENIAEAGKIFENLFTDIFY